MLLMERRRKRPGGKRAQDFVASRRTSSQTCVLSDRTGTMLAREYAARGGSSGGSRSHYPARLVVVALVHKMLGVFQGS